MATAKEEFNALFDDFLADEFFSSAKRDFEFTEVENTVDIQNGTSTSTETTYSAECFQVSPTKSDNQALFEAGGIQANDILISVKQDDLVKSPSLEQSCTLSGKDYVCKAVFPDPATVQWKILLRA